MNDNLISLSFAGKTSCIADPAWQHDYGQVAVFTDIELDEYFEVHFSNTREKGTASVHMGADNRCEIPAGYFMTGLPVYGWIYTHPTDGSGETEYSFVIPVRARPEPDPEEDIPEPERSTITRAIEALTHAVETAEGYRDETEAYRTEAESYAQQAGSAAIEALRSVSFAINEEEGTLEVMLPNE